MGESLVDCDLDNIEPYIIKRANHSANGRLAYGGQGDELHAVGFCPLLSVPDEAGPGRKNKQICRKRFMLTDHFVDPTQRGPAIPLGAFDRDQEIVTSYPGLNANINLYLFTSLAINQKLRFRDSRFARKLLLEKEHELLELIRPLWHLQPPTGLDSPIGEAVGKAASAMNGQAEADCFSRAARDSGLVFSTVAARGRGMANIEIRIDAPDFEKQLIDAMVNEIADQVKLELEQMRCDVHGEQPSVIITAKSIDNIEFQISGCCDQLKDRVTEKLGEAGLG